MEAYNIEEEELKAGKLGQAIETGKSYISIFLGVIITVLAVVLIFIVASLEGTREIKANNSVSGKLLTEWRVSNEVTDGFPEEKTVTIMYKNREYYFVIKKKDELNNIEDWYWAYDGGIEYIFSDYKFYVLTAIALLLGMYVSYINYIEAVKSAKQTVKFNKTLKYYQEKKSKIELFTQYIPDFCIYKNEQTYELAKMGIVQKAGINYRTFLSPDFDGSNLEKWQKKVLKKIKKIKVKGIQTSDLLQEANTRSSKISLLPMGESEHLRGFLVKGFIQKLITSALSGLVVGFGVILGNWVLGLTYGVTIIISYVTAIFIATDYVNSTLRNRFIAKSNVLNEFYNIKEKFIPKKEGEIINEFKQQN
jgi:hypothetical protein